MNDPWFITEKDIASMDEEELRQTCYRLREFRIVDMARWFSCGLSFGALVAAITALIMRL